MVFFQRIFYYDPCSNNGKSPKENVSHDSPKEAETPKIKAGHEGKQGGYEHHVCPTYAPPYVPLHFQSGLIVGIMTQHLAGMFAPFPCRFLMRHDLSFYLYKHSCVTPRDSFTHLALPFTPAFFLPLLVATYVVGVLSSCPHENNHQQYEHCNQDIDIVHNKKELEWFRSGAYILHPKYCFNILAAGLCFIFRIDFSLT